MFPVLHPLFASRKVVQNGYARKLATYFTICIQNMLTDSVYRNRIDVQKGR